MERGIDERSLKNKIVGKAKLMAYRSELLTQLDELIPVEREKARKEALIEAAKIARTFTCGLCGMDDKCAKAIEALIEK